MTHSIASKVDGHDTTSHVAKLLRERITAGSANDPRSLQKTIGPSGVGTPCDRRLAYTLLGWEETNNDTDPLAAIIGKAVHSWLADTFEIYDDCLVEQRVRPRDSLPGNSDLYYKPLGAVIDWKVVGATAMKRYRTEGISPQYRAQIHLYGLGLARQGEQVNLVGCAFIPRTGRLSDLLVVLERYDENIAHTALDRMDTVVELAAALDLEHNPAGWQLVPTADAYCTYCPFFLPGSTDLSKGCPGDATRTVRATKFEGITS